MAWCELPQRSRCFGSFTLHNGNTGVGSAEVDTNDSPLDTVRLQSDIVLLCQGRGQHGVVPGLESQARKLTGVLKESLACNTSGGQHFAGYLNALPLVEVNQAILAW